MAYWENAHWSRGPVPGIGPRGYFKLFVEQPEREAWNTIASLTRMDELGYMSSISPDPMDSGKFEGCFCICVHTYPANDEQEKSRIENVLNEAGFGGSIQDYQLNFGNAATREYYRNLTLFDEDSE